MQNRSDVGDRMSGWLDRIVGDIRNELSAAPRAINAINNPPEVVDGMKPYLITFLVEHKGKSKATEYWYTSQSLETSAIMAEVEERLEKEETLRVIWIADWRLSTPIWEIVAEYTYNGDPQPSNAEYFIKEVRKKQPLKDRKPGVKKPRKKFTVVQQPLTPLCASPFRVVVCQPPEYKQENQQ